MKAWGSVADEPSGRSFGALWDELRWRARLRAIRLNQTAQHRQPWAAEMPPSPAWLDRLSPWGPDGYRRKRLRGVLYRLRYPRYALPRWWWSTVASLTAGSCIGPGRYEGNDPVDRPKVEWLDMHREYATRDATSDEEGAFVALFEFQPVPWSGKDETWLVEWDSRGFVTGEQVSPEYGQQAIDRAEYGLFSDVDA